MPDVEAEGAVGGFLLICKAAMASAVDSHRESITSCGRQWASSSKAFPFILRTAVYHIL